MKTVRRRQRRRPFLLPTPLRWAGTILLGSLFAWGIFKFTSTLFYPYQLGEEQARKVAQLKSRLAEQDIRNAGLEAQLDYLRSEEGAETLARRAGYHRPNETVYLLAPQTP